MNSKQAATLSALECLFEYRSDILEVKQTNTLSNGRPIIKVRTKSGIEWTEVGSGRYEVYFELNEKGEPVKANGYEYIGCVLDLSFKEATEQAKALCARAHALVQELAEEETEQEKEYRVRVAVYHSFTVWAKDEEQAQRVASEDIIWDDHILDCVMEIEGA
jgi:hypothetical protein